MADSWDSVVSKPAYQSLPPDQQAAAKSQYFDSVVAPKVPKEHLEDARAQFESYTPKAPAPASEGGFMSRVGQDLTKRANEGADAIVAYRNNDQGLAQTGLQLAGKMGVGAVGDIIGEGEKSAVEATPNFIKTPIKDVGKAILNTDIGKAAIAAAKMGEDAYNKWSMNNPNAARSVESVVNIAAFLPASKGVSYASKAIEEAAPNVTKGAVVAMRPVASAVAHPINTAGKALDVAGGVLNKVARPVVDKATKSILDSDNSVFGGGVKKSLESDTAKEGERLGKKLGVNFSTGELTGNPTARNIEDALANISRWSSKFTEENTKKTDAIVGNFKKTLDSIYPNSVSRSEMGDSLTSAYKGTIDSLVKARREQSSADFARAREATGDKPIIAPHNFVKTLRSYINEGASPTATPAQRAASSQANTILKRLENNKSPKPSAILNAEGLPMVSPVQDTIRYLTVDDLQNGLAAYGEGAKSAQGGIWKGLATASDRRFANAAKAALEADMDGAANSGGGEGAAALKIARDNYRAMSGKISDIQQTSLGKIIGSSNKKSSGQLVINPEQVTDRFLSMEPTELKNTLKFLDTVYPNGANMARRYTLEAAYKKAVEGKGQRGVGTTKNFAKAEFVNNLPSDEKLTALMGTSQAANDVKDVAAALNRMIDYGAARKGSDTAMRTDMLAGIASWGKGAIYRAVISDSLAEDLLNPQKRQALVKEAKAINDASASLSDAIGAEENPLLK